MLFNTNWNKKPQPQAPEVDPASLLNVDSLIAWLETKDPNERYCYTNPRACLLAQYFRAHGFSKASVSVKKVRPDGDQILSLPGKLNDIAHGSGANDHTFGAALKRAQRAKFGVFGVMRSLFA